MQKITLIFIAFFYILISVLLFNEWVKILNRDTMSGHKQPYYLMLVVLTILWPVVVPISYLELLSKKIDDEELRSERNLK